MRARIKAIKPIRRLLSGSFFFFIGAKCITNSISKAGSTASTDGVDEVSSFAMAFAGWVGWAFF